MNRGSGNKFMIVAGEHSGDLHSAKLVNAIRDLLPDAEFFGAAGPKMRDAGVRAVVDSDEFSIVGLPEIARALPMFLRAYRELTQAAEKEMPGAVILVDFPEFNLKLARSMKNRGVRVIYYISPQIWAWRKYRIRAIRKYVDLLISILPFEKDWYRSHGVENVAFVGNPLATEVFASTGRDEFRAKHAIDQDAKLVALLPGSRTKEVTRILPILLDTAAAMLKMDEKLRFVVPLASERHLAIFHDLARRSGDVGSVFAVTGETFDAVKASDAAAVTSGTATLETGILGTPMAIVYKTSAFNYKLLRPLIDVEHFGLINLIAEERVATELIQDELTVATLSEELFRLLEPGVNEQVRSRLAAAADKLGHGGASKRAAGEIVKLIRHAF
jgi:lipid-A-disaccharide synthase